MDWLNAFIIPLIKITFIGGIISWIVFVVFRGISRNWKQNTKWFFKYSIRRNKYPESIVVWCYDAIEKGIGYYDAKKLLYVHNGNNMELVYETLYIYDVLVKELHSKINNKNRTKEEIKDNRKFDKNHDSSIVIGLPQFKEQKGGVNNG